MQEGFEVFMLYEYLYGVYLYEVYIHKDRGYTVHTEEECAIKLII